jgi:hypothetical protein
MNIDRGNFANREFDSARQGYRPRPTLEIDRQTATRIAAVLARIALGMRATVWLDPNREPLDAEISEVLFRAITLKTDQLLPPESVVEVRFKGDIAVRGTMIRCQPREGAFYARLALFDARLQPAEQSAEQSADREARRDERFAVRIPGTLRAPDRIRSICLIEVMDVSRSGLRVRCECGLPQGTQIHVNCRGTSIQGEVRYSRQVSSDEYHIGIYAHSVFRQSTRLEEFDLTMLRDAG